MNAKFTSKNIKNTDSNLNNKSFDYENLISRLQDIRATIAFLEKTISR